MKTPLLLLATLAFVFNNAQAQTSTSKTDAKSSKKMLILVFSHSGNTLGMAQQIKTLTNADLIELKVVDPYPSVYKACTEQAKKEKQANARPALKNSPKNLNAYDVIFIGYPNWWGTAPMPILTLLDQSDWAGKTLIPFVTHGGGGEQNCLLDFSKHSGKATVLNGLVVDGEQVKASQSQIEKWIKGLKLLN